jgi:Na+-transporting methylmalonyl-CoA/oxaloacetate decarboxylase gamma subunit
MGAKTGARRLGIVLTVLVIAIALILVIGEILVRSIVPGIAEDAVRKELNLEQNHEVDFEPHGFLLMQVITGHLKNADMRVPDAPIVDGLAGTLEAHAGKVALNPMTDKLEGASVVLTLSPKQFDTFVKTVSDGEIDSAKLDDGKVLVSRSVEAFGAKVPLTAEVSVAAKKDGIEFTPIEFSAAGIRTTPEDVAKTLGGVLGPLAKKLEEPQTVCVRDHIPRGLEITDIDAQDSGAVKISIDVNEKITTDAKMRAPGSCK